MSYKIFEHDPRVRDFEAYIDVRMENYYAKKAELSDADGKLYSFADRHEYFGIHRTKDGWVYREWAPAADAVFFTGDMVDWDFFALELAPIGDGVFEIYLPEDMLYDGCHVKTVICKGAGVLERIPIYTRRAEQDPDTLLWCGIVWDEPEYVWKESFVPKKEDLCVYECHIGMAQEKEGIGTYREFIDNVLPRIKDLGYNTIQVMAIMEHPYYGSFGYQVSSFFASSFRYGTPNELKELIDTAHGMGINVILDLVHSHAVSNTLDGINQFDGSNDQFFHEGERGDHPAWGTKLFNYGKNDVIRFLLSNLRFWMEEYHFDGFRFDGVTSMLYYDHGLGVTFDSYMKYFSSNTDDESITYLQLANDLIREINPNAITIAEDMSAMPGMCLPISEGGIGFDYRLAMGEPDLWIKLTQKVPDEAWSIEHIWKELTDRRPGEKSIGYVESHDQALVGDQTLIFRLCGSKMYFGMGKDCDDVIIERGISLHKLIRMAVMTAGGEGYLNFMGNEFGHPEWIDFPREGNNWSYSYCRRQWNLVDSPDLKYQYLNAFDKAMLAASKECGVFGSHEKCLCLDETGQVMMYESGNGVFALNFTPVTDYTDYRVTVPSEGAYKVLLTTDEERFGGHGRIDMQKVYTAVKDRDGAYRIQIDLPARTGVCLVKA